MRRAVIGGAVFGTGAALMCVAGRNLALTWMESAFMAGVALMSAAGMYLVVLRSAWAVGSGEE